jgi:hypothetical protein
MAKQTKEPTIAERITATKVPAADMLNLANEANALPPNLRDFEGLMFTAVRMFAGEPNLGIAAVFRMEALGKLINRGRLPGWTKPEDAEGGIGVHQALFAAAGELPLYEKGKRLAFNRREFLTRAFQLAKKR